MTIPPAITLAGVPPLGLGVFGRNRPDEPGPWLWRTGREWGFVGVEAMRDGWRAACDRAVARAVESGQRGVIFNPETRFPASEIDAMAAWVRSNATRTRLGFVSFPSWGGVDRLAAGMRGLAWASVELFYDDATNAAAWAHWRRVFGLRLIPTVVGYDDGAHTPAAIVAERRNPAGYARYLSTIPRVNGGAIVWPNWPMPQYMKDALAARFGGANLVPSFAFAGLSALDTWPGLVVLIIAALVALAMFAARGRVF